MIDGTIAYEIAAPENATVSEDEFPEGLTDFTNFFPLETQAATASAIRLLAGYAVSDSVKEPSGVDRDVYQAAAQYVNDEFGEYFGQCPGPTVVKGIKALGITLDSITEDTIGSSVGEKEFVASYFGVESAAASLWRLGFLPSFDGTTYRLHSGSDGTVVYSGTLQELQEYSNSATGTNPWLFVGLGVVVVLLMGGVAFFIKRKNK
jgi:LPXTG-motif cell wall-anchored protein